MSVAAPADNVTGASGPGRPLKRKLSVSDEHACCNAAVQCTGMQGYRYFGLHMQISTTQPTGGLVPLITTKSGVSLVFDPLIRKPSEVAAAIVQDIAAGVNSAGR